MQVKAEKEVNSKAVINFSPYETDCDTAELRGSSGGSRVANLTHGWESKRDSASARLALLTEELLIERPKIRNSCMFLTPSYVFCVRVGFNAHTYTHRKSRQNLTASSTILLVYWLLSNTSGKKLNATLSQSSAQHPESPYSPQQNCITF